MALFMCLITQVTFAWVTFYLDQERAPGWISSLQQHLCDPKVGWRACKKINVFFIFIFSLIHYQFLTWYQIGVSQMKSIIIYMMIIKTVYLYQRTQSFKLTQNISKFIIIQWERRLKKTLLSWSNVTRRIWLQNF